MSHTPPGPPPPDWPADSDATRNRPTALSPEVLVPLHMAQLSAIGPLMALQSALSPLYGASTRLNQLTSALEGLGQRVARLAAENERLSAGFEKQVAGLTARVEKLEKQVAGLDRHGPHSRRSRTVRRTPTRAKDDDSYEGDGKPKGDDSYKGDGKLTLPRTGENSHQGLEAPTGSMTKRFRSMTWKACDDEPDSAQGDGDDSYKGDCTKREGDGGSASVTWECFCNTCRTQGVLR